MKNKNKTDVPDRTGNGSARAKEAARREKLDRAVDAIEETYLAAAFSISALSKKVLKAAKVFTGSAYGFASYIDPQTGWLIAPTRSRRALKGRGTAGKPIVFKEFSGLWGWVLKHKTHILTNAAASDPRSGAIPRGHVKIDKFLAVPAVFNRSLAGIIALANPGRDYSPKDLAAVKKLARVYAIIIQRKLAEDRLKEGEVKYRTLFETANAAIFIADIHTGTILDANKNAEKLLGRTRKEILGMQHLELHPPEEAEYYEKHFQDHIARRQVSLSDAMICRKDGTRVPVQISASITEVDGKKVIQGIFEDVTEHRLMETALKQKEETLRKIFDTAKDAIFVKDLNGVYVKANKYCAGLFGLTPERMEGKSDFDLLPRKSAQELYDQDQAVIKTGDSVTTDNEILTVNGGIRVFNSVKVPLFNAGGGVTGVLGVSRDMTEFKKLQNQLNEAKAMEAVAKVARPAAHDFNNILAAINGYATLIMETLKAGNPAKPEIEQILNAVKRAADITDRLQTYGSGTGKKPDNKL